MGNHSDWGKILTLNLVIKITIKSEILFKMIIDKDQILIMW